MVIFSVWFHSELVRAQERSFVVVALALVQLVVIILLFLGASVLWTVFSFSIES